MTSSILRASTLIEFLVLLIPLNSASIKYHTRIKARIFDVFVEGILVLDNLDLISIPGGNVSYVVSVNAFVTDGHVTIDLVRVKDNPQINGIEVFDDGAPIPLPTAAPSSTTPPTPTTLRYPVSSSNSTMIPVAWPLNAAPIGPSNTTTAFQDIVINCGGK